ncbi:MAG: hypothetical protein JXB88_15430 [Spirochaetales bacterium]|nr:hypothetical protein [Spirochaetales bacterium]
MGAVYGSNFLEISFQGITDKYYNLPTREKIDIYTRLFNVCCEKDPIRVFLDNVLYEWTYSKRTKSYSVNEYKGHSRQTIIEHCKSNKGNGAPYSYFDGLEGWNILLPAENIPVFSINLVNDLCLDLDYEGRLDLDVSSISDFIIFLQRNIYDLEIDREAFNENENFENILDFKKRLIIEAQECNDYKLLFVLP